MEENDDYESLPGKAYDARQHGGSTICKVLTKSCLRVVAPAFRAGWNFVRVDGWTPRMTFTALADQQR
jgi:hypothetical protein